MNTDQIRAAHRLLALIQGDLEAQADTAIYGNWLEHMAEHLADIAVDAIGG